MLRTKRPSLPGTNLPVTAPAQVTFLKHECPLVPGLDIAGRIEKDLPEARVPDVKNCIERFVLGNPPLLERGGKRKEVEVIAPGNRVDHLLQVKDLRICGHPVRAGKGIHTVFHKDHPGQDAGMGARGCERNCTGCQFRAVRALGYKNSYRRGSIVLLCPVKRQGGVLFPEMKRPGIGREDGVGLPEPFDQLVKFPDLKRFDGAGRDHRALTVIPRAVSPGRGTAAAGKRLESEAGRRSFFTYGSKTFTNILRIGRALTVMPDMDAIEIGVKFSGKPLTDS